MVKYDKISKYKQQRLQELFLSLLLSLPERPQKLLLCITILLLDFFKKLRILIAENMEAEEKLSGDVDLDECDIAV